MIKETTCLTWDGLIPKAMGDVSSDLRFDLVRALEKSDLTIRPVLTSRLYGSGTFNTFDSELCIRPERFLRNKEIQCYYPVLKELDSNSDSFKSLELHQQVEEIVKLTGEKLPYIVRPHFEGWSIKPHVVECIKRYEKTFNIFELTGAEGATLSCGVLPKRLKHFLETKEVLSPSTVIEGMEYLKAISTVFVRSLLQELGH